MKTSPGLNEISDNSFTGGVSFSCDYMRWREETWVWMLWEFFYWCENTIRIRLHMIPLNSPYLIFISFFFFFFAFAFFSMLFIPFCFFPQLQPVMQDKDSWQTQASLVVGTPWPLPHTRLENSPLHDSVNNWPSCSCQHHVSLEKGMVNTIMVPISNSL